MKKWYSVTATILLLLTLSIPAEAQQAFQEIKVLVLPFKVHAFEDRSALGTDVTNVLKTHLKQAGAQVVVLANQTVPAQMAAIRQMGIARSADYVIWGSLTLIGQQFSLDAKLLHSFGKASPTPFFVDGQSIEKLPIVVKDMASEFIAKMFRKERVASIRITGNQRIEADAIKKYISTSPGDMYLARSLSKDLKSVYSMGYFEDIRIESQDSPKGKIITFHVTEKPTIRNIRVKNAHAYSEKEIKDELDLKTGSILNIFAIKRNIKRIEALYKDKNYHNVQVTYEIEKRENNQADITFIIEEGKKVLIKTITFLGNKDYTDDQLKKIMKTNEKGFWSFFTGSGELDMEELTQDIARLSAFYYNTGYIQARVSDPEVKFEGDWIYITIKIDEGPRFKVGTVTISGDIIHTRQELMDKIKIDKETWYNREVVRTDVLALTDIYSDEGYAYVNITPKLNRDFNKKIVDIDYQIDKGKQVYFEKILISGNTVTRDKVIRRELNVYEQELYSGSRLKRGIRNLNRLDYFEDVKVDTLKGSADDKMILKVEVTEKSTRTMTFGGGYSSVEDFFITGSVSFRNFLGRGQTLSLKGDLGSRSNRFTVSFTEPYVYDTPLSLGIDLYNWDTDMDLYDKNTRGGGIRTSYPVWDFTRAHLSYYYEVIDIDDIDADASHTIWELEGSNVTSKISATLRYDSRDRVFNPTEGQNHAITVQYAGLGGDIAFTKYLVEAGVYIPLFWGTVGFVHGETGYVRKNTGGILPDYDRFYLGGINSMRGFDWRDIHAVDENGAEIGGNKYVQFNVEYIIPLIKKVGVVGVLFFDTGNVFNESENIDLSNLRESAGYGFRWYSPMGPIRIENGYILDPQEGESRSGRWEFTIGHAF